MKIVVLGAGNVAHQLSFALQKAGHELLAVYNRSTQSGEALAQKLGVQYITDIAQLPNADIYLIAVKDDAIEGVAKHLLLNNKIVAHTSGTKSKDVLKGPSSNYGIFYPLQTMTKSIALDFAQVPMLIEGSNEATHSLLQELANTISQQVYSIDETQRQWVHLAAVFANNFTNHLYGIAEHLLLKNGIAFELLKPLILRSVQNLEQQSPTQLQTGPASRGDQQTIDKHVLLLADDKRLAEIYTILTQSILSTMHNKAVNLANEHQAPRKDI